ncbi:hypothetical protein A1Q2_03527 [Trichosporon asahii var. asahii CBS 8904]|uniref:Uncharacterized protein n=2 Tax=Trichosporon asahii var. asahii TaxID=189963 RepID=K1VDX5_TRIAC|nr:hypothetical protein A1Q1_07853 [Trichosporon asahii var. asahii CBS 2479]EJT53178.1 hypothetical protein A1Q1_07853 [Trichosporon asahii var. asahii CBS 2479]EKD02165.1 hypothetical protein A1Q2_03527 [Trichosporon asahii var. asahii CBS 8904]
MKLFAVLPLLAAAVSAQFVNLNARGDVNVKTIDNKVTSKGLCSGNAQGEFSYSPETEKEKLTFKIELVSKENPVKLVAHYKNEATGEHTEATIDSANPSNTVGGEAVKGQKVVVTVKPEGASNDACEYSVSLDAKAEAQPTPSATQECPTYSVSPTTVVETATSTVTVPGAQPTGEVCLCDCDVEGAKPLPKIEL